MRFYKQIRSLYTRKNNSNSLENNDENTNNFVIQDGESECDRAVWKNQFQFLFSCIAMSVGLGNLWRFPFIAYENGGGAFLVPYIIILIIVGKSGYLLETLLGQFSSRGTAKLYDFCPAMRGIGYGQVIAMIYVISYYSSISGIALKYLYESSKNLIFGTPLPWTICKAEWGSECYSSLSSNFLGNSSDIINKTISSPAQLYFDKELYNATSLSEGIGNMNWNLFVFLLISWVLVFLIVVKGIQSSGKFTYVLAIFPYILLFILLIKALSLEGASEGIFYFFYPKWEKICEAKVWYEATTQIFFSLGPYFGMVVMYASYNKFDQKSHIHAHIVTTLDTFTSILAGSCVFAVLGHLKHELGVADINDVIKTGAGMAFITYPEAIARFGSFSSIFGVLFFLMLFVVGIGSLVGPVNGIRTAIKDNFEHVKDWKISMFVSIYGLISGSIYYTQSGQDIIGFVDNYGVTFVTFNLAIFEIFTLSYIYGIDRILFDIKFMLKFTPSEYWIICWKYLTPVFLVVILIYDYISKFLNDSTNEYPLPAKIIGYLISASALIHLPLIMIYEFVKSDGENWKEKIKNACSPLPSWGPRKTEQLEAYQREFDEAKRL